MSRPVTEVSIVDDAFTETAHLQAWLKLGYRLALNAPTRCSLDLALNDPKIDLALPQRYIRIMRDDVDVWLGRIQMLGWMDDETSSGSNVYPLDAWDMMAELGGRTLPRPVGMDFNKRAGPADDILKEYAYYEAGAGAIADRRINGLTVDAATSAVVYATKLWLGGTLLEHLQRIAQECNFYFGLVPTYAVGGALSGMELRTAYPLWGADRTKGQAGEIVLSRDNVNLSSIAYKLDLTGHINHVYVAGPGEDQRQLVVEVDNRTAMTTRLGFDPGRRERWITSDNITVAGLTADGEDFLAQNEPVEVLTCAVLPGVIGPEHLGCKITNFDYRYGRVVQKNSIITALNIAIDEKGVETITPELTVVDDAAVTAFYYFDEAYFDEAYFSS
jgi:hypothetical protein